VGPKPPPVVGMGAKQDVQVLSCTVYAKPFPLNVTEAQVTQAFGRFGRWVRDPPLEWTGLCILSALRSHARSALDLVGSQLDVETPCLQTAHMTI
jgi:hypothetical protein